MNIFYLHFHPKICAVYHNDKHVVKMILETAQLLYSCCYLSSPELIKNAPNGGYKLTHKNHPSAIWTRQSIQHYYWLCWLGIELCNEYTFRYSKIHACQKHIEWLQNQVPNIPNTAFIQPPQAMPDIYKHPDSIIAYRTYYIYEKKTFSKWKNRKIPHWFKNHKNHLQKYP